MKRIQTIFLLLVLLPPALHAAEPLGRLFFTPAQRNSLDAGKELDMPKKAGPAVRGPRSLTVNGIVTRSDGESTVWVNGRQANIARPSAAPIHAKPSGSTGAKVRVLDSESKLRVGQTLDRRTGRITEAYQTSRHTVDAANDGAASPAKTAPEAAAADDPAAPAAEAGTR